MATHRTRDLAPYLTGPAYGVGLLFVLWRLPETKGKSLGQIERDLAD